MVYLGLYCLNENRKYSSTQFGDIIDYWYKGTQFSLSQDEDILHALKYNFPGCMCLGVWYTITSWLS